MQKGEELIFKIDSLSGDGSAVARQDDMVVFVECAVPGDLVRAKVWKVKKKFAEARAVEILEPSSFRIIPRCKHFGVCGGCKWQNFAYESQLQFKHKNIVASFQHIAGFKEPNVLPVIGCENPYFYRNKMEFTFSNYRWLTESEFISTKYPPREVALGLHIPQRYDKVLNINECFLQSELSMDIFNSVRELFREWNSSVYSTMTHEGYLRHLVIRDGKRTGEVMVNLVTTYDLQGIMTNFTSILHERFPQITTIVNNITERKSMVAYGEMEKVYYGPGYISERIGDYTFRISANSFFQTNTIQAEKLYDVTKQLADLKPSDVVYDLYSGTGSIAICLSDVPEQVIGLEIADSAVSDAKQNAEINGVSNCFFLQGDLKDRLTKDSSWLEDHPRPSVIIVDPPRSGIHPKVIEQTLKLSPERIVYVSCNPSTQARDAKLLYDGNYQLKIIQPIDMFPHTDHIESVALFTR